VTHTLFKAIGDTILNSSNWFKAIGKQSGTRSSILRIGSKQSESNRGHDPQFFELRSCPRLLSAQVEQLVERLSYTQILTPHRRSLIVLYKWLWFLSIDARFRLLGGAEKGWDGHMSPVLRLSPGGRIGEVKGDERKPLFRQVRVGPR